MDGADSRGGAPQGHSGKRLLHPSGGVSGGQGRLSHPAQLPHVQDVLLPLRRDAAGLPDAAGLRPDAQRGDREQGHQVQAPGGGLHLRALAGAHLQGEEAGEPRAPGPQAPRLQHHLQTEVHLQKDCQEEAWLHQEQTGPEERQETEQEGSVI